MLRRWGWMAVALLMILMAGLAGCGRSEEPQTSEDTLAPDVETAVETTNMRETILYFKDANGYMVPVMQRIPWEEGIGRAALKFLTAGEADDAKLAARGVYATLPEGTRTELNIVGGKATVNLMVDQPFATASDEQAMVASVVDTLMEFPTVDTVEIWLNGQKIEKLPQGTDISKLFEHVINNIEPVGAPASGEGKLQLYYGNATGTFIVPVMRVANADVTPVQAVQALLAPAEGTDLMSLLPPSTQILSVTIGEDGVATVDLSSDFLSVADMPGMERMALRALTLTLTQFANIKQVNITINGQAYEPTAVTTTGLSSQYLNVMD